MAQCWWSVPACANRSYELQVSVIPTELFFRLVDKLRRADDGKAVGINGFVVVAVENSGTVARLYLTDLRTVGETEDPNSFAANGWRGVPSDTGSAVLWPIGNNMNIQPNIKLVESAIQGASDSRVSTNESVWRIRSRAVRWVDDTGEPVTGVVADTASILATVRQTSCHCRVILCPQDVNCNSVKKESSTCWAHINGTESEEFKASLDTFLNRVAVHQKEHKEESCPQCPTVVDFEALVAGSQDGDPVVRTTIDPDRTMVVTCDTIYHSHRYPRMHPVWSGHGALSTKKTSFRRYSDPMMGGSQDQLGILHCASSPSPSFANKHKKEKRVGSSPTAAAEGPVVVGIYPHHALPLIQRSLVPLGSSLLSKDISVAIISTPVVYFHYGMQGIADAGWGCAYRSLQSLVSNLILTGRCCERTATDELRGHGCECRVPHHGGQTQDVLRKSMCDLPRNDQWIGSMEVSAYLDDQFEVPCRIIHVAADGDVCGLANHREDLLEHFQTFATPGMIGGGVEAQTLCGVRWVRDAPLAETEFLVLDPHFRFNPGSLGGHALETERLAEAQRRGYIAWHTAETFSVKGTQGNFHNVCLPMPDRKVAGG
eukprot:Clim_evm31s150 gene=Clim_evmTU31s150